MASTAEADNNKLNCYGKTRGLEAMTKILRNKLLCKSVNASRQVRLVRCLSSFFGQMHQQHR